MSLIKQECMLAVTKGDLRLPAHDGCIHSHHLSNCAGFVAIDPQLRRP